MLYRTPVGGLLVVLWLLALAAWAVEYGVPVAG
jgi:hypothetical protein